MLITALMKGVHPSSPVLQTVGNESVCVCGLHHWTILSAVILLRAHDWIDCQASECSRPFKQHARVHTGVAERREKKSKHVCVMITSFSRANVPMQEYQVLNEAVSVSTDGETEREGLGRSGVIGLFPSKQWSFLPCNGGIWNLIWVCVCLLWLYASLQLNKADRAPSADRWQRSSHQNTQALLAAPQRDAQLWPPLVQHRVQQLKTKATVLRGGF